MVVTVAQHYETLYYHNKKIEGKNIPQGSMKYEATSLGVI